MGTWDNGILDNDTAMDGLGDLQSEIVSDIERFGAAKPTATSTAKLAAAVGVLLQLSSYEFGLDTPYGPKIVGAVKAHAKQIAELPVAARKVLDRVAAGEGRVLAERPAKLSAQVIGILHSKSEHPSFGQHERSLFAAKAGAAYVQEIAKRCIEMVDDDFADEENWSDLCREGMGMGCLAVLLILDPCKVPMSRIERWRKRAQKGIARLEKAEDEELSFHRGYYANLDRLFALLAKRFATAE